MNRRIFDKIINFFLDPCAKKQCGINAICKVVFATGRPFCACPFLMVGDPNVKCGKIWKFEENILLNTYIMKPINRNLYNHFSFYVSDGEEGVPSGKYMYMIIELND